MKRRDFLKRGFAAAGTTAIYGLSGQKTQAAAPAESQVLAQIKPTKSGGHYSPNRAPLRPSAFMKLPVGSIAPKGWLRTQLEIQANGLNGRMMEVSDYLNLKTSGWVVPANSGFEEVTYWLRGFAPLGYVLGDARIMDMTKEWVKGIMATQQPDGWFGPLRLKTSMEGGPDMWPHMPVLYAIRAYQEYTGDPEVIPFMTRYFQFQNVQSVQVFGRGWGAFRWGDNIDSIYWLYNRTGDAFLLDLVKKIHANSARYTTEMPTYHNVNLSQGFREPAQYSLLDSDPKYVAATHRVYDTIFSNFGQFAGGGFAGDEGCRPGFTDPRQGFETCGVVELMLSYEILTRITGDPAWADRCEQITFNTLPAALDPLQKGCHYVTSANSSALRNYGAKHKQYDNSPMSMQTYMPGVHNYRCCPHNYGMGWPMFAENLWLATNDGGLCASLYAASEVTAKVADGGTVKISTETDYPFRDTIKMTITAAQAVQFPLYLRIPAWCQDFTARINGQPVSTQSKPQSYLIIDRTWNPGDVVTLHLPMQTAVKEWKETKNAVSVSHGPLEYSLAIKEDWYQSGGSQAWPEYNINPGLPWNYGLVLDPANPAHSFDLVQKGRSLAGNPFTTKANPLELRVSAKKISQWRDDSDGFTPVLQSSPALSSEAVETVSLIPMGAARLRLTTFPTITDSPEGHEWQNTAVYIASVDSSQSRSWPWTPQCLLYNTQPASSRDIRSPRASFNYRSSTSEWIQYKFPNPVKLSAAAAYWFEDAGSQDGWYPDRGHYRVPKSWYLEYRDKDDWKPVQSSGAYGVALNQNNRVEFETIITSEVRMMIEPDNAPVALYRFDLFNVSMMLVPTVSDQAVATLKDNSLADHAAAGGLALVASFQADRITEKSARNAVTTWLDGSSGVNDAVSSGDSAPTLVRDAINGLPALRLNAGHRQRLVFDRPVQDDFTIAVVFRSTQGIGQGTNYFEGAGLVQGEVGGVTDDFGLALNAKGQVVAGTGKPDISIASPSGFNDGKAHLAIFERVKMTGAIALYVDGRKVAAGTAGTQSLTAPPQLGIGAQASGANCLAGDIGEIAIYAQALSEADRNTLEGRLMTKWKITTGTAASR